jgi:hypothetical protein
MTRVPDVVRPSAEQLLERIKQQDRAKLRVYIGAAPGVGKTYSMLEDARALKKRGVDVVIGLVETYGRTDTEAQIGDLEMIPAGRSRTRASGWRRWTSTPSSRASRRCASSTSSRTPTCPARGTRSATGMSSSCSTPAST